MWGFIRSDQHLESQLEANWQSVQLSEERYCIAVLDSLLTLPYSEPVELSLSLQGQSHVEHIAVIKLEGHQGMNDRRASQIGTSQLGTATTGTLDKVMQRPSWPQLLSAYKAGAVSAGSR